MQCPDCGAYYSEEDEFCGECGRRLSSEASSDSRESEAWSAEQDSLEDLAGELFEPPQPQPALAKLRPRRSNLRSLMIVGVIVLRIRKWFY